MQNGQENPSIRKKGKEGGRGQALDRSARRRGTNERASRAVDWDIDGAAVTVIWFMDMPSIFYAVRPMNTDRSDAGQRWPWRLDWPEEIIGTSAYMDISITRAYADEAAPQHVLTRRSYAAEQRCNERVALDGTARRGTSHYDSSGVRVPVPRGSAEILIR